MQHAWDAVASDSDLHHLRILRSVAFLTAVTLMSGSHKIPLTCARGSWWSATTTCRRPTASARVWRRSLARLAADWRSAGMLLVRCCTGTGAAGALRVQDKLERPFLPSRHQKGVRAKICSRAHSLTHSLTHSLVCAPRSPSRCFLAPSSWPRAAWRRAFASCRQVVVPWARSGSWRAATSTP